MGCRNELANTGRLESQTFLSRGSEVEKTRVGGQHTQVLGRSPFPAQHDCLLCPHVVARDRRQATWFSSHKGANPALLILRDPHYLPKVTPFLGPRAAICEFGEDTDLQSLRLTAAYLHLETAVFFHWRFRKVCGIKGRALKTLSAEGHKSTPNTLCQVVKQVRAAAESQ